MSDYKKNLLNALRLVTYKTNEDVELTNERIIKAVTINEELQNLGYTLNPNDLISLAKSESLDAFINDFRKLVPEINVEPMYPDFPKQVMEMSEAEFRFNQMVHYFSTYGMESLFGVNVDKGWLPNVEKTEKTQKDTKLLSSKVLGLIPEKNMYERSLTTILSKRERMTNLEKEIIKEASDNVSELFIEELNIPFKENMENLFMCMAENKDRDKALSNLHALCQHTGDVLRFTEKYLNNNGFHLTTSEKRLFVKLLECYPSSDFRRNLVHSESNKKRNLAIIQHLDYNKYSRNPVHKDVVNDLRNNRIKSWENTARRMIEAHNKNAVEFVCERPGMAIRMISLMIRNGYGADEIANTLKNKVSSLSMQTLMTVYYKTREEIINGVKGRHVKLNKVMDENAIKSNPYWDDEKKIKVLATQKKLQRENDKKMRKESERVSRKTMVLDSASAIVKSLIDKRLELINTPLKNLKVCIKDDGIDLRRTAANPGDKSMNGGYIPSTISYKIPDNAKYIRAYVYWNDKSRVDVDMHATAIDKEGKYVHIGWDGDYNEGGIVFSGDITHSNAAEYIDIDLNSNVKYVGINFDLYCHSGYSHAMHDKEQVLKNIETCFAGIMAVDEINENVKIYSPENSFFTHDLKVDSRGYKYGYIDVENKTLRFLGESTERSDIYMPPVAQGEVPFSMDDYLKLVIKKQEAELVETPEEADIVLTMAKPENDKELSLIDNNFFYDYKAEDKTIEYKKETVLENQTDESAILYDDFFNSKRVGADIDRYHTTDEEEVEI